MFIIIALFFFAIYKLYKRFFTPKRKESLSDFEEKWFGKTDSSPEDVSINPFKISVPDSTLEDLKLRLKNTRLEEPLQDSKFLYGFNPDYLKSIIDYWINKYDWRKQEAELNKYPHFKTKIEGIDVHFMHVKPSLPEGSKITVIPILIVHGWPGSFVEFYKMIPFLTTPEEGCDFVFEVICPSIPGYGFSESAHRRGMNARSAARMFVCLMGRLGHTKYYLQGGDWGSFITSLIARYYPEKVLGIHLNCFFSPLRGWNFVKFLLIAFFPFLVSKEEYKTAFPLKKRLKDLFQESGYFHMQSTKPDTLGCGMADSPAGVAAYLLEKFSVATDPTGPKFDDGLLTKKFTLEELLTNVMIYWVNNNFTAAARFYKENLGDVARQKHEGYPIRVPSAVALFPNEVINWPRMLLTGQLLDLVHYNIMPRGGHFAAMEEPQLLAEDIQKFVQAVRKRRA